MRMRPAFIALVLLAACGRKPDAPPPTCAECRPPAWTMMSLLAGQPGGPGLVDGDKAAAHFVLPLSGSLDGAGHFYLADRDLIRRVDVETGAVMTFAGSLAGAHGSADGIGTGATLELPNGVAATPDTVWVTDTENHTVRKIDVATRAVTTVAGKAGLAGSDDGIGGAARFHEPEGLALDPAARALYIADTDNHVLRKMNLDTLEVTTLAGTKAVAGATDGPVGTGLLDRPAALAIDAPGANLYFVERGSKNVRRFELASGMLATLQELPDFPGGVAVNGASLLVTCQDRIFRVDLAGAPMAELAGGLMPGFVDAAGAQARLSWPQGLVIEPGGTALVVDTNNYVLRRVRLDTGEVSTASGANSRGAADGTGTTARFDGPQSAVAGDDVIYLADTDNGTVRAVTVSSGEVKTLASGFTHPSGLALGEGVLYVADTDGHAVREIAVDTGAVQTVIDGLGAPHGLALAGDRLFVSDNQQKVVLAVTLSSRTSSVLARDFVAPAGLAFDGKHTLYVADVYANVVRQVDVDSGAVSTLAGAVNRVGRQDGPGPMARFFDPTELALDAHGNLYVADTLNLAVRRIALDTAEVSTLVGNPDLSGVRLGALPGQLGNPSAVAVTRDGNLAVVSENAVLLVH